MTGNQQPPGYGGEGGGGERSLGSFTNRRPVGKAVRIDSPPPSLVLTVPRDFDGSGTPGGQGGTQTQRRQDRKHLQQRVPKRLEGRPPGPEGGNTPRALAAAGPRRNSGVRRHRHRGFAIRDGPRQRSAGRLCAEELLRVGAAGVGAQSTHRDGAGDRRPHLQENPMNGRRA